MAGWRYKNLKMNEARRYDRGTDAMHLANTPVVSPKSKSPDWRGSRYVQIVAYVRCHRGAALPSMNELSKFLARFQCLNRN
jgi:hypothetical protein